MRSPRRDSVADLVTDRQGNACLILGSVVLLIYRGILLWVVVPLALLAWPICVIVQAVRRGSSSGTAVYVLDSCPGGESSRSKVFRSVTEPAAARPFRSRTGGRDRRVAGDDGWSAGSAGEGLEFVLHDEGVEDFEHRGLVVVVEGGEVGEFVAQDVLG